MPAASAAYTCGIDIGTTKVAAVLFDPAAGRSLRQVSIPHEAAIPAAEPGGAEQDAEKLIQTAARAVRELGSEALARVRGLGVTGQMHGVVLVKAGLRACSPLFTWQDRRVPPEFLAALRERTGRPELRPGFGAVTLAWLFARRQAPGDAIAACTIHDLLVGRLCGLRRPVTDPTNAESWGAFEPDKGDWNRPAWRAAGVPLPLLPRLVPSGARAGEITAAAAAQFGLPAGIPVAAAIGDNQASIAAALRNHDAAETLVLTLGTGGQLSAVATDAVPDPPAPGDPFELRSYPGGRRVVVAAALCGGSAWKWLAETACSWCRDLGLPAPAESTVYARLNQLGAEAGPDARGLRVLPRFLGERNAPEERGVITGIDTGNMTLGTLARALAFGIIQNLFEMFPNTVLEQRRQVVGTGNALRRNPLLQQAVREISSLPLFLSEDREEAATGAAWLAAAG